MPEFDTTYPPANTYDREVDSDSNLIVFDNQPVGFVDRDGNIRLTVDGADRVVGHIANDRDHAIVVLRDRYIQYVDQTRAWCEETRAADNRLWRISDCDKRVQEIEQQYVLGTFAEIRDLLTTLKAELLEEQQTRITQRQKLIAEAKQIRNRTDWKEASQAFEQLNEQFRAIGTVGDRNIDTAQWDDFKGYEREFRKNRRAHYDELEKEFISRAEAKTAICDEAETLQYSPDFKAAGQRLRDLMDTWKQIGFAGRDRDEELWQRFQAARGVFHERRKDWFAENAELKEQLAARAEALAQLEDAASAQQQMKPLMQKWRETGSAGRNADDALWARFRGAQEDVYQRSRTIFDSRHQDRLRNYELKQALVLEVEALVGQDSRTATQRCKELQQEWKVIGPVPREQNEHQWQRFRAACDSIFRIANAEGKRRIGDARDRAEDQIRKLSAEIDEHERKIAHWEGVIANLRDGSNADEIREAMTAKIATANERIAIKLEWIEEHHARMIELRERL